MTAQSQNQRVNPSAFSEVVGTTDDAGRTGVIGSNGGSHAFGFLAGNDPVFGQHSGVYGESDQQGVMGLTTVPKGTGVYGGGTNNAAGDQIGVRGETGTGIGVKGLSNSSGIGVEGISNVGFGVFGKSNKTGVAGQTASDVDAGVNGRNDGNGFGVFGESFGGPGVEGHSTNGTGVSGFSEHGLAGRFQGDVEVTGNLNMSSQTSDITLGDVAEGFSTQDEEIIEPGTVVVLNQDGLVRRGDAAYDKKVAGVISGAGGYRPAIVLDKQHSQPGQQPVALMGKVCCKVDAQYSPIEVGDLLTTSPTPGHAMKAADPLKAFGSVIGKALRPLNSGQGMIPILIALQ